MRKGHGVALLEALGYLTLLFILVNMIMVMSQAFFESHHRVTTLTDDLDAASRFLRDVKDDLRRARSIEVEPDRLVLDGGARRYEFRREEGTVVRLGPAVEAVYGYAFASVRYSEDPGRLVSVDIELRKHNVESEMRPRLSTVVFCRHREGEE